MRVLKSFSLFTKTERYKKKYHFADVCWSSSLFLFLNTLFLIMFGFLNLVTLASFAAVGSLILAEQMNAEIAAGAKLENIDQDITQVENSLGEVQNLLEQIEQDPEQKKQFSELRKHVTLIRDQLHTIQEEYHLNKDLDKFNNRINEWHGEARDIEERLKRDLEAFHYEE